TIWRCLSVTVSLLTNGLVSTYHVIGFACDNRSSEKHTGRRSPNRCGYQGSINTTIVFVAFGDEAGNDDYRSAAFVLIVDFH
ncbi:hypothetical protein, partial [Xenorhabdus bovienii]|uniref:hypothetical protein n=1 Tax=Xenorhabdus bovienii TaxID=40576 RepID=UPI0039B3CD69